MKFASVDDPLNMYRNASSETAYVFEITNITNEENVTIAPGQRKVPVSIWRGKFCKEQAFPHLLLKGKFGYMYLDILQQVLLIL